MAAALPSLLDSLREATRSAHAAIEHVPALSRLMAGDLTRADYGATLSRLYRFHAGLEPALAAALADLPELAAFTAPERSRAIAADLAELGLGLPPPAAPEALPVMTDAPAALGCLYVVEGSALGGRVIARRLADTLGVTDDRGARFFGGQSAQAVRSRWLALCAVLETLGQRLDPQARDRLLAGAVACFTRLGSWMGMPASPQAAMAGARAEPVP
jgi:heme oxygenase